MPKRDWKPEGANPRMHLKVQPAPAPKAARLWSAQSATRDFRMAQWSDRTLDVSGKTIIAETLPPYEGFVAFYAELEYEVGGLRYFLSTQLRIAGNAK